MSNHPIEEGAPYDLKNCARCGGDHNNLTPKPLGRPISMESPEFTHWHPCPTNGEPILWASVEDPKEDFEEIDEKEKTNCPHCTKEIDDPCMGCLHCGWSFYPGCSDRKWVIYGWLISMILAGLVYLYLLYFSIMNAM